MSRRTIGVAFFVVFGICNVAGQVRPEFDADEKPIADRLRVIRSLPDDERARTTTELATRIRQLQKTANKENLAIRLASVATEGDPGRAALQEVATMLAEVLAEQPVPSDQGRPAMPYVILAQLVRYEHVNATCNDPQFSRAIAELEADDQRRRSADFTLADLQGRTWSLRGLRGNIVLVNFWATWCGPCRKEMPDFERLYARFKDRGLIILAISDEDPSKVKQFAAEHSFSYPILLDRERKVNQLFHIEGVPKTFVYDRSGKLVAQSIDMRTQKQLLEMLAAAGLR